MGQALFREGSRPEPLPGACYDAGVGLTYVDGRLRVPGARRARRVRFLVDSGAVYSVLRRTDWQALGLAPERTLEFVLADGTTLTRGVSECSFEIEGRRATSPVVLGESEDEALLGAVTLETLGLMLNPLSRTLQPMRMVLARSGRIATD
jgi:predicted aspartyl protease